MRIPFLRRPRRRAVPVALAAAIGLVTLVPSAFSEAATPLSEGMICTTDANNTFTLAAGSGYVATPDGNSILMWSYTTAGSPFQLPGPTLCVTSGTTVTVVLRNTLPEATSLLFPGQLHVQANGHPSQPQITAGTLTALSDAAPPAGTVTYSFTAGAPGTYLYTSGSDVAKQQEMGLMGALVVRPAGHAAQASDLAASAFDPAHEYLMLLSEVDPDLHLAVERGLPYNVTKTVARYFMINGRSMPDTLAPNNAAWLPAQPYGALVHIKPTQTQVRPALIRFLNAGPTTYPFHPHGSSERIINRDGAPVQSAAGLDASTSNFLLNVGPGQSMDALESWTLEYAGTADPANGIAANPIPPDIKLPQLQDQIVGPGTDTWFSENPYLGAPIGATPTGIVQNNQCGEYYHVAHSHALDQATNYGASFGGMMTLIRIDPPTGCP